VTFANADSLDKFSIPSKNGLRFLNNQPLNAETLPHFLDDKITPNDRHFVRNNGLVPSFDPERGTKSWTLTIDGEVHNPLTLKLEQLKRFKQFTYSFGVTQPMVVPGWNPKGYLNNAMHRIVITAL
jgi:DMSO/TMAO reductase YedYZ molybdopterin-dependent catalytic subunit